MNKRITCIVSGRVQGVLYRATTRQWAQQAGVVGTVRNLDGGTVEVVAEGDEEKLAEFLKGLRKGSPFSRVDDIVTSWEEPTGEFPDFRVIHSHFWNNF